MRVRDGKERLARALLSTYRLLMLVLLPTATGLLILAPEVVSVLAGEKWLASVPFLQVFAFQGLVRSIFYQCGLAFDGLNRPHYNLLSALVVVSTIALGILIVIALGLPALACVAATGASLQGDPWTLIRGPLNSLFNIFQFKFLRMKLE